ncbi:hypothetical protein EXIGLDRAFT_400286 [Exidia glandulosa HHB12029]|uniref:Osmotin, thaumatin-like protein n=1 Tax=Exidia glandulosa HHB12029 TaxID=1314781 RepID=A0A165KTX5_EXIGL|nr:hypothetical protein EXIGLDRAFT_400286 [Exidia glandulosa HHB12029]
MSRTALIPLFVAATAVMAQQPARSIKFKNSCPKDVWVVGTSGATGNCADGCQEGSTCNAANGLCFFDVPMASNGNWRVPVGGENTVTFPAWNNDNGAAWSGNFNACMQGTICAANGLIADEALCDSQGCASFHVGSMAEITMAKKGIDFYDVSNIGGLAVPMSFGPEVENPNPADPYFCATLGALKSTTGLGDSTWQFPDAPTKYHWVIPGDNPQACSSDADCGGATCGLALNTQDQVTFTQVCGTLAGYWTQNASHRSARPT